MGRKLFVAFTIAVLAAFFYFLSLSPNPFIKYNHRNGIAYYKQGPIPFFSYEVDEKDMPFNVLVLKCNIPIVDSPIFAMPKASDTISFGFRFGKKTYSWIKPFGDTISNAYFSIVFHATGVKPNPDYKGLYYFKFIKNKIFDNGFSKIAPQIPTISRQTDDSLFVRNTFHAGATRILDSSSAIAITINNQQKKISDLNVYIKINNNKEYDSDRTGESITLGYSRGGVEFVFSKGIKDGRCAFFTPEGEIKVVQKRKITDADFKAVYYFKFSE
jgi:hypothetical protein